MMALAAMTLFVLSHVLISRTRLKSWLVDRWGTRVYLAAYSALSVLLFALVIEGLRLSDRVWLWPTWSWTYVFAALVSLLAFMLMGVGAIAPNPLSVAFRRRGFDACRPGIIGWVRHPLLWGLALWGLAHVPANGNWPAVIVFGGSFVFGVIGIFAVETQRKRRLGPETWQTLTAGPGSFDRRGSLGAALGLLAWCCLLLLHPLAFGPDPLGVLWIRFSAG